MSQQIINIPINWDDDALTRCIEQGVEKEIKDKLVRRIERQLGISDYYGMSGALEEIIKGEIRSVLEINRDKIINEVIKRMAQSVTSSKVYKEAVNNAVTMATLDAMRGDRE